MFVIPARSADTPVATLSTAEAFFVTSMRLWFAEQIDPEMDAADWRDGFRRARLDEGAMGSFDTLLRIVGLCCRHGLDIRWQGCSRLGADEAVLLHCLGLLQSGRVGEAYDHLGQMLCACAVNFAASLCEQLARLLWDAGLVLPDGAQAASPPRLPRQQRQDPQLRILH